MPEDLSKCVVIKYNVNANHAGNMENRRAYSGIIICVKNSHVLLYSKIQNTVEYSSSGSIFFALRIFTYMIDALQYKLNYFGLPVYGPAELF